LLNFEAVDWETQVWIDGYPVGKHYGGYDPFTFDITQFLDQQDQHELIVQVYDPTDAGQQARGKQVSQPHGIWYTSTSGIWASVWLEPVPDHYIRSFHLMPDIDSELLRVKILDSDIPDNYTVEAIVKTGFLTSK
jgi:beta-galactosidase/beta-glucuronidase